MKTILRLQWLVLCGALAVASSLNAQDTKPAPPAKGGADEKSEKKPDAPAPRAERPRDRMQQLSEDLKLTEEQKAKLAPILREEATKNRELRADQSLTAEQRREKRTKFREEIAGKVKAVLSAEQFEKWQKSRQENAQRQRRRAQ